MSTPSSTVMSTKRCCNGGDKLNRGEHSKLKVRTEAVSVAGLRRRLAANAAVPALLSDESISLVILSFLVCGFVGLRWRKYSVDEYYRGPSSNRGCASSQDLSR